MTRARLSRRAALTALGAGAAVAALSGTEQPLRAQVVEHATDLPVGIAQTSIIQRVGVPPVILRHHAGRAIQTAGVIG